MDSEEASTYLETAEEQLSYAEQAFKDARYALSVFLGASSAENAASSVLVGLGAKPSKKHKNSLVLLKLSNTSRDAKTLTEMASSLEVVEPHITKARYPVREGPRLLSPGKFYTRAKAREVLVNSRRVVTLAKGLK